MSVSYNSKTALDYKVHLIDQYILMSWYYSTRNICNTEAPDVFYKKSVFINFTKFMGKHLARVSFLRPKLQNSGL